MSDEASYLPFDPLAVENVGVTLAVQLLEQPIHRMPPKDRFRGAGVYALYYSGLHPAYAKLVGLDRGRHKYPVYVGKAVRENSKQGFSPSIATMDKLFQRISQHAESISAVDNLEIEDFRCRFIILNDAYITLAESVMIRVFRPPWNGMGFGAKVVGAKRMSGRPSLWDSVHPGRGGRPLGNEQRAKKALDQIKRSIDGLHREIEDPILGKMYGKIMRFV